jgi:hypothetical protein
MLMPFRFHVSALVVLPFWFAMIVFPRAVRTERLVRSPWIILPPAACYLLLALPHAGEFAGVFVTPGWVPRRWP